MRHDLVAACLDGFEERSGVANCRILLVPERNAYGGWIGLSPAHIGQCNVSVASQQSSPVVKACFNSHVVDSTFALDQVEGSVREVETAHVRYTRFQSVRDSESACLVIQSFDKRWVVVDGDDV